MGLLAQATDYTDKDFDSLRLRLQSLVRSVFPDWTDFNVANFGNILVELYAFVGDVLTFYQDNQARESRLLTATQRKNLIALTKLLGFRPAGARAATVDEIFSLAAPPPAPVTLHKGTRVRTASVTEAVVFQLLADVVIPAGAMPPTATGTLEHSEPQEDLFASTGLPNQEVTLPATPYLDGSAVVSAGNGAYVEVQNFLGSTATDRHFTVVVDQNDRATIRFGNGVSGALPSGTITVDCKTGGGAAGNVNAGTLTKLDGSFTDDNGGPVSVFATNSQAASGGADRQTVPQIQALAPESIRVLNRTVSREDFEINARRLPEVARALMLTSNEDAGIAENTGILFVIPRGGGAPSQVLKDAVKQQVTVVYPCTLTFQVSVQDPSYLVVDVQTTVYLRQGANVAAVRAAIMKALGDFFAVSLADGTPNPTVEFGFNVKDAIGNPAGEIAVSDVFDVVHDVPGVRKIGDGPDDFLLNGARQDLPLGTREFPALGQVTLINGDTGLPL
ncbi:MAG TPA: baseplate J/gp47 family protein [Candidatus Sulfotelmatobacter sp.]|nr:baseplate J/gp47 family protein [Candidatus Sulfotelmatobacter sp.]